MRGFAGILIVSHPNKVFFFLFLIIGIVVVVVVRLVVVVVTEYIIFIIVGPRKLALKYGQNQVSSK